MTMSNAPVANVNDLKKIADVMDRHFKGPFGWRFGWDGVLGLVPVLGDVVTNSISVYVILRAAQVGCPPSVIVRMGLNLAIENLVDIIPIVGNLFDFVWKANSKNMILVERYLQEPNRVRRNSKFVLAFAVALILAMVVGSIVVSFFVIRWIILSLENGGWAP